MRPIRQGLVLLAAITALAGCEKLDGKVTAGGTLNSLGGNGKAVFTVNAQRCNGKPVKGHANFQDKTAIDWQAQGGVSFNARVTDAGLCGDDIPLDDGIPVCDLDCGPGQYQVDFDYRSTNPALPGEGSGIVCLMDTGEGVNRSYDTHGIINLLRIDSGPFSGYANMGSMSGNVQAHDCPAADEDGNS
ncbi:hypothetical protein [Gallaecimonas sp. GXIMD4217]|uniref:hypothetical protein n=1 Tax=Gallaecimonas sp. GXIMD4217 TaxID=3131927 RepID=UPI00311AD964